MKKVSILLLAILCFGIWSCNKSSPGTTANLRLVNLSPNSSTFDLYINNALLVGGVGYGANSGYIKTTGGTINAAVAATGSSTASVSGNITLNADSYNSIFVFDSLSKAQGTVIVDDRTAAPSGKVNIRFFNFVSGGSTVDILRAGTTKLFSSRSFNDQNTLTSLTAYTAFDPGPFSVSAVISGTTVLITSLPSMDATAGKSYTLVLKGFPGGTISLTPIADN